MTLGLCHDQGNQEEVAMAGRTYKVIELVGTSDVGVTEAINEAITRAADSIKGLDWFEVSQIRGQIEDQKVAWYQVDLKVGFRVMSAEELKG
jgi:flavin-binding protein dodecin